MTNTQEWARAKPTVLRPESHYIQRLRHIVPPEVPFEAVLRPEFWAHVAPKLRPQDEIVVSTEDGSWRAELVVRWVRRLAVGVSPLHYKDFAEEEAAQPAEARDSGFDVEWGGPSHKWRVVRKSDRAVVKKSLETQAQAEQWVKNHQVAQAA